MNLHRIVPLAPFVADADWSATQVVPPAIDDPTSIAGTLLRVENTGGTLYWFAIPFDGDDLASAQPCTGAGMTFDARVVYARASNYDGKGSRIVVGRKSPGEVEGAPIPIGREIIEHNTPRGSAAIVQLISVAGVPAPATHLWIFWIFESKGGL